MQSLTSERMLLEEDVCDRTSQAHSSFGRFLQFLSLQLFSRCNFFFNLFSFWDLKCHFLTSQVNAGFRTPSPKSSGVFSCQKKAVAAVLSWPILSDFRDSEWDPEHAEAQTEWHDRHPDFFCNSLLWCLKARRMLACLKALSLNLVSPWCSKIPLCLVSFSLSKVGRGTFAEDLQMLRAFSQLSTALQLPSSE